MDSDEANAIIRHAFREEEVKAVEVQERIRQERIAAYEAEAAKLSPADLIQAEWDELERPFTEGWQVRR